MNPRTTIWLTAIALGLLAYICFVDLRTEAPTEGPRPLGTLLPGFDPSVVTSVEVVRSNHTVRAELLGGQWQLLSTHLTPPK
ncbi:MAG: hypothetical protein U1G07_25045 [Verrucomicrobiota bacterium]